MKLNRYSVRKSRRRWVIYRNGLFLDQTTSFSKAILIAQELAAKDPAARDWDRGFRERVVGPIRRHAARRSPLDWLSDGELYRRRAGEDGAL